VAREHLLDDPECALPPVFDEFKQLLLSCNRAIHTYFDNFSDATDGVLPVAELRRLAEGLGEVGRSQLLEEFAQDGARGKIALLLLKGLFDLDRKNTEASVSRGSQAAIKAYGLYSLPADEPARSAELAARYRRIQAFAQEAQKLKAGRRLNSLAAARAALGNLAQVAGFRSIVAMELEIMSTSDDEVHALPSFSIEPYLAKIAMSAAGPELIIEKNGRPQKAVPAAIKKLPGFVAFKERLPALADQFGHFSAML